MQGNLLEGEDVWLDTNPDDVVRIGWDELSTEAAARDLQLKWPEQVYGAEGIPADEDQAIEGSDALASDGSADDATVSQDGDQVPGEASEGALRPSSGEIEATLKSISKSGEEGLATGASASDKVGPSYPRGLDEDQKRYWKRLERDYDI
jgi:hypothetical protein